MQRVLKKHDGTFLSLQLLEDFITEYFDQNPISQVCLQSIKETIIS